MCYYCGHSSYSWSHFTWFLFLSLVPRRIYLFSYSFPGKQSSFQHNNERMLPFRSFKWKVGCGFYSLSSKLDLICLCLHFLATLAFLNIIIMVMLLGLACWAYELLSALLEAFNSYTSSAVQFCAKQKYSLSLSLCVMDKYLQTNMQNSRLLKISMS